MTKTCESFCPRNYGNGGKANNYGKTVCCSFKCDCM